MTGLPIAFKDDALNLKPTDVTPTDPLPVEDDNLAAVNLVLKTIVDLLGDIDKNLTLLNVRFEEAFRTNINEGDI